MDLSTLHPQMALSMYITLLAWMQHLVGCIFEMVAPKEKPDCATMAPSCNERHRVH